MMKIFRRALYALYLAFVSTVGGLGGGLTIMYFSNASKFHESIFQYFEGILKRHGILIFLFFLAIFFAQFIYSMRTENK